ncbi:MAG: glycosyl hydrolase 108 family protein [Candidatus Hinthialibacter sp.]
MMGDFQKALGFLLEHEGGYTSEPEPTQFGVGLSSLRHAGRERGKDGAFGDFDGDGDIDADDVKKMTQEEAAEYYRRFWWDRHSYEKIVDDDAAAKIFDLSVNIGPRAAHRLAQRAINQLFGAVLLEDGILGKKSLAWINGSPAFLVLGELRAQAWRYYQRVLAKNPQFEKYRDGWRNRAYQ